ncbi:Lysophospholipid acyltransferase 7-like [Oopsacas minuta]|uniref:Lysophospholipid acyltransferase 7 n=1 Tax=Oopsacas minuta TaxID=111878 RepID=A0AAV7JLH5_9METZ|nr:Lysophospholipid acyltransferase 7-like [Oopsacas minuta]
MLASLTNFILSGESLSDAFGYKDDYLYISFLFLCLPLGWINRCSYLFGLPPFSKLANAVQLLLTLRLVSLAADTREYLSGPLSKIDLFPNNYSRFLDHQQGSLLSRFFQYTCFSYCFLGLFTGPFFRAKTYNDMICNPNLYRIPYRHGLIKVIFYLPLYISVHLILAKLFPFDFVGTEEYYAHEWGALFRLAYFVPYCVAFRWRFYIAWTISVASCILAGLGAYPESAKCRPGIGPTCNPKTEDNTVDYKTVENLEVWEIETSTTIDGPLQHWNMTVQSFFYYYIYKSFPNRTFGRLVTFALSAYWHGLNLGYYIAFFMFMFCITAQYCFIRFTQPLRVKGTEKVWLVLDFLCAWRAYEYNGFAFLLLTPEKIFRAWASVYYIGHYITVVWVLIGAFQLLFGTLFMKSKKKLA